MWDIDKQLKIHPKRLLLFIVLVSVQAALFAQGKILEAKDVKEGSERMDVYLPFLRGQKVAVVANQTSLVEGVHLVDTLLSSGVNIQKVFAPEHGFRGLADAGEKVKDSKDRKTGLPVISLYGSGKKPKASDLQEVEVVLFDIQDVGVRFYTYISTMHYVMEACAENGKQVVVLDRPNPNGYYVDGPVLQKEFQSFVGMHPIPLVHGMTIGEVAKMINGEGWLKNGVKCDLKVIRTADYTHSDYYQVPVKPSPNLPNMASIYLYPSLGLFEGTIVSVGRGTAKPFQVFGFPEMQGGTYVFTPESMPGAKYPPYKGEKCMGFDLTEFGQKEMRKEAKLYLHWLKVAYKAAPDKDSFFRENGFFDLLAGTDTLRKQIIAGKTEKEIRESWSEELEVFKQTRKKYLLYQDFE